MCSNQVFFSICIPTYNSVHYLKRLLNSLFAQKFSDFEIVISDDSTTDEVMNYCNEIEDNRITYFKHTSIQSATEKWNNALNHASGKYRMLIHHDDYFSDNNVLKNIFEDYNENGEKDALFLGFINEDNLKKFYYDRFSFLNILKHPDKLLFVNFFSSPSCLIIHEKISLGYDEKLKWLVDVDFYQRLIINYSNINYLPNVKMVIGGSDERITNTISKNQILSEFFYLRNKKIYKKGFAIFLIKWVKLKIIFVEFLKFKILNR
jgi:glycosyltransferase involved in cell wall biosynthesis